jgi:methylglutaconyl-CoA hydratase
MEENKEILYTIEGSTAFITLNRPEKRNALNENLIAGLKTALLEADKNEQLRAIVISGAGKDFCAGADLTSLQKISESSILENLEDAESLMELFLLIRKIKVPVIAAVRGRALAGGCGLASACDIVLAASSAQFSYTEVKIGFVPAIVMAILRRNLSEKRAFELITKASVIDALEAERIGLINRVFEDANFDEDVKNYAREYENVSQSAVALTKSLFYQMDGMAFDAALKTGTQMNAIARMTDGCRKGIARFLKK